MHKAEDTVFINNKITAELGRVVAMRVVEFSSLQPIGEIQPKDSRAFRLQARAFELIGFVNGAVTVKENIEGIADFLHPLIERGKCSEGNDKDSCIELFEFILARAQLCGMFTTGYSAKVTEEDKQGVAAFEDFAEGNLFAVSGCEGEVGSGGVEFECHEVPCQVSGEWKVLQVPYLPVYLSTCLHVYEGFVLPKRVVG